MPEFDSGTSVSAERVLTRIARILDRRVAAFSRHALAHREADRSIIANTFRPSSLMVVTAR
jgi:hypothetical protein